LESFDRKKKGLQPRRRLNAKEKGGFPPADGFPALPTFSDLVKEIVPLAVNRHRQRPKKDQWMTVDPRNPKNRFVTTKDGQKRIAGRGGALLPLYRDWEKEVGKPIGDSRPYYRKHMGPMLMPYHQNPSLETMSSLIVVEGLKDWDVIKTAVNAHVFVCDGASILSHVFEKYVTRTVRDYEGDVIMLMDPDTAGRRMRTTVNELIGPCKHAFISEYDAVVGMGTQFESIGIENASPDCIRNALKNTKTFRKHAGQDIHFDTLYEMGLVQTPAEQIAGVRLRRRFTCGFLGIGFCDGRQLLKQLNGYSFSLEEIQEAVSKANLLVEEWKQRPWRIQKDYSRQPQRTDIFMIPNNFIKAF